MRPSRVGPSVVGSSAKKTWSNAFIWLSYKSRFSRNPLGRASVPSLPASEHLHRSLCDQCSGCNPGFDVGSVAHGFDRSAGTNLHLSAFIVQRAEHGARTTAIPPCT